MMGRDVQTLANSEFYVHSCLPFELLIGQNSSSRSSSHKDGFGKMTVSSVVMAGVG